MTFNITTFSTIAFNITTLSIMTLSTMGFNIITTSKMTKIMALTKLTFNIATLNTQHNDI